MSVTNTPLTSHQVTIKNDQGATVTTLTTNSVGHAEYELPPGKYSVEIATLSGYTVDNMSLVENGGTPAVTNTLTVTDVDIISAADTVITGKLTNA